MLEFRGARASNITTPPCLNIQWPGRFVATQIFYAQAQYKLKTGTYAPNMSALSTSCTLPRCDPSVLTTALSLPHVFGFTLRVQTHPRVLDSECSAQPCYTATVTVSVPAALLVGDEDSAVDAVESGDKSVSVYAYNVSVNQNMRMLTHVHANSSATPCL